MSLINNHCANHCATATLGQNILIFNISRFDKVHNNLTLELSKYGMVLDYKEGLDIGENVINEIDINLPEWLSLAAVIVCSILFIMVIFLAIAYKLSVSK